MSKLQKCIDKIIAALLEAKDALSELSVAAPADNSSMPFTIQSTGVDEFGLLRDALFSNAWPHAVSPDMVCDPSSEEQKVERGKGIIELLVEENLQDLKFLDFGCGQGQTTFAAAENKAKIAVGFDTKTFDNWQHYTSPNLMYVNNWQQVVDQGPYDVILLFDVIDHVTDMSPVELLNKLKTVLDDNGKIYMRTHPYMSKHALHHYNDINKAFVHLVFTPEELNELVPSITTSKYVEDTPKEPVIYPLKSYKNMIDQAGLKVREFRETKDPVDPFFKTPIIASRIMKHTGFTNFPEHQLNFCFIDYQLQKPING